MHEEASRQLLVEESYGQAEYCFLQHALPVSLSLSMTILM
jgi:hypothetical protein